jgi:hypothetical protein
MVLDERSKELVTRGGFCAADASDLGWAIRFLLCLISFVLRLQDNFCSFVAIELIPTKIWNSSQHLCRCLLYTSHNHFSNRPISPNGEILAFLSRFRPQLLRFVIHQSNPFWPITNVHIGKLWPWPASRSFTGIWRPFPRSTYAKQSL